MVFLRLCDGVFVGSGFGKLCQSESWTAGFLSGFDMDRGSESSQVCTQYGSNPSGHQALQFFHDRWWRLEVAGFWDSKGIGQLFVHETEFGII